MSKGLSDNQRPMVPLKESLSVFFFGYRRVSLDIQEWASTKKPPILSFDRTDTIDKRSSWMLPTNGRPKTGTLCLASRVESAPPRWRRCFELLRRSSWSHKPPFGSYEYYARNDICSIIFAKVNISQGV